MNVKVEIEKLPPQVQQEVFDYVEFLVQKYENTSPPTLDPWIKNIERGRSVGISASETTVNMRGESQW
jgi:hypothetical protein